MKFSKDEYTLRNFSKIQHKKWELYIITRIIHFLNDPDIEFVCQQLLKTRDGKRYLADLCFPSLKLYYEIDEAQHGSDQHKIKDEHRQREIVDATDFIEKRISVFDKNKKGRNINEINIEVDAFIDFIYISIVIIFIKYSYSFFNKVSCIYNLSLSVFILYYMFV